jgi:glycosidase
MKKIFTALAVLLLTTVLHAQVVTTSPAFPVDGNGSVTITFHADQGNMGLNNYSGDVYIHTGILIQGFSGWQNVVTTWGVANPTWKMTSIGNNTYTYTIADIRAFYGVTTGQVIDSLAMVFRNTDGSLTGKASGGNDIFVQVVQQGAISASFTLPTTQPYFKTQAQALNTTFVSSANATIAIYENNVLQSTTPNTTIVNSTFTGNPGVNWVKGVATAGAITAVDSFYYVNTPATVTAALPTGMHDGINYIDANTVTLVLVAPNKNKACVVGDFNNWIADLPYFMNKTPDGKRWWITLSGLTAQQQYAYQFIVDDTIKIADPYTDLVLDPVNDPYIDAVTYPNLKPYPTGKTSGIVSVLQTNKPTYQWTATGYQKPAKNNLVIYELLVRDFVAGHNYQQLIDTLSYLKNLGITAIELMPFSEFEGNISWGYNPNFYFAPDKYYGTQDKLKAFIDACHAQNIAVIMDMVLNHSFGSSPMCQLYWDGVNGWPTADNPWFNTDCDPATPGYQGKHPYGVGFDINHESLYTKKFVADVLHYWAKEFKMDGYRFDLSKGFTQKYTGNDVAAWGHYDSSRIAIWEGYADSIWSQDSSTYIILEHFADNDEETVLANDGMMLWDNTNNAFMQSAMGYPTDNADLSPLSYLNKGWQKSNAVGYMESHDEERVMYKCEQYGASNGSYNIKNISNALNRVKLNATFFFTVPGPKMIWQFGELGYDTTINMNGRTGEKPLLWSYYNVPERKAVYDNFKSLIFLKNTYPASFNTSQFTMNVDSTMRSINLNAADPNIQALAMGNFGTIKDSNSVTFHHTGWWYDYFTGDSLNVANVSQKIAMNAGEYRLYLSKRITPPGGTTAVHQVTTSEDKAKLFQNYPNPFGNTSTVEFYLPTKANASLELFDLNGRRVDVIANKEFQKGLYSFDLQAGKLHAGIYYIVLNTNGQKSSIAVSVAK